MVEHISSVMKKKAFCFSTDVPIFKNVYLTGKDSALGKNPS
jgi:hypothetical protein